jgi:AcrR family transcriptional regulator
VPKAAQKAPQPRRPRGSINPQEIIAGAFEVARRASLDQLSMPALAEHLGVGVTSIYWYFRKKDELLSAMLDVAVAGYVKSIPALSDEEPWQDSLLNFFRATRDAHSRDQILSDILLLHVSVYSPAATQQLFEQEESVIRRLVSAGFTTENAFRIFNAAMIYARGMAINDRMLRLANAPTLDQRQSKIADWSVMPLLGSLVHDHSFAGTTNEDFEFGMSQLIVGFEAVLRQQGGEP